MKTKQVLFALLVAVLCVFTASVTAQTKPDKRLMTPHEYSSFLDRLERALPQWEKAFLRIDAEKMADISYSNGKAVMNDRDVTVGQIGFIRKGIYEERISRKVSREFRMAESVGSVFEGLASLGELLQGSGTQSAEAKAWLSETIALYKEVSDYRIALLNDVQVRIELLEKGVCK